jgi:hypothetical protein
MAIADFAARPLASDWFLQDSHIQSIRIEVRGMEVEEPSGEIAERERSHGRSAADRCGVQ